MPWRCFQGVMVFFLEFRDFLLNRHIVHIEESTRKYVFDAKILLYFTVLACTYQNRSKNFFKFYAME
jgi:hypothetical protein